MAKMKFPNTIHVRIEDGGCDEDFLIVEEEGVMTINESKTPIAIYKLVSVGIVEVGRRYVEKRRVK
jgi:hypothetical protein